jgi:DNA-binding transcriptional ArsR family regulator
MPESNTPEDRILGAAALKAFAHPLRMKMYDYLSAHGPATATQLARRFGESTGQTSYHLRQLERHGIITDDPAHESGRERWWKPVGLTMDAETLLEPGADAAAKAMLHGLVAEQSQLLTRWVGTSDVHDDWNASSLVARRTPELTLDELRDLVTELQRTLDEHSAAALERAAAGGGERRRVRVYLDVFPVPEEGEPEA